MIIVCHLFFLGGAENAGVENAGMITRGNRQKKYHKIPVK